MRRVESQFPPGPRAPALLSTLALQRDPIGVLSRAASRYGETFSLRLLPLGRVVATSSPAVVERMLTGDAQRFAAGSATRRLLPVLGDAALIVRDGAEHRERRRAMLPAFGPRALEAWVPALDALAAEHVERWPRGRPFAVLPLARELAFAAVAAVVGLDRHEQRAVEPALSRLASPPVGPAIGVPALRRRLGGLGPWAVFERRAAAIDRVLARALERSRGDMRPRPVIDHLLDLRARGIIASEAELLEELRTLLLVGHETTTAAMAWTVLAVARHPEALRGLDDDRACEAVVEEVLRLHPPVVDVVRELGEPLTLGSHRIPAGTVLVALPALLHRRGDLYRDPCVFSAGRFAGRRPDPFAWIPFGGGVRRCLGATLALSELKALLRALSAAGPLRVAGRDGERAALKGTTLVPAAGGRVVVDG